MSKLRGLVDLVEEAIENGANSVEEIHQTIASQPLEILKNIAPLENASETIQDFQERTIGSVYETIRTVNTQVAELAKKMLDKKG